LYKSITKRAQKEYKSITKRVQKKHKNITKGTHNHHIKAQIRHKGTLKMNKAVYE